MARLSFRTVTTVVILLALGCGRDARPAMALPTTSVGDVFAISYRLDSPEEARGILLGHSPEAGWYRTGDVLAVHVKGLQRSDMDGLCVTTELLASTTPQYSSHVFSNPMACPLEWRDHPSGDLRDCHGDLLFLTRIPASAEGTLVVRLEVYSERGGVIGLASHAEAFPLRLPEINHNSCTRLK